MDEEGRPAAEEEEEEEESATLLPQSKEEEAEEDWVVRLQHCVAGALVSVRHAVAFVAVSWTLGRAFVALPLGVRLGLDGLTPFAVLVAYSHWRLAQRRAAPRPPGVDAEEEAVQSDHPQRKRLRKWLAIRSTRRKERFAARWCPRTRGECARGLERGARRGSPKTLAIFAGFFAACDAVLSAAEGVAAAVLRRRLVVDVDGSVERSLLLIDAAMIAFALASALASALRASLAARCLFGRRSFRPTQDARRWRDAARLATAVVVGLGAACTAVAAKSAVRASAAAATKRKIEQRSGGAKALPFPSLDHMRLCRNATRVVVASSYVPELRGHHRHYASSRPWRGLDGFAPGPVAFPSTAGNRTLLFSSRGARVHHSLIPNGDVSLIDARLAPGSVYVVAVFGGDVDEDFARRLEFARDAAADVEAYWREFRLSHPSCDDKCGLVGIAADLRQVAMLREYVLPLNITAVTPTLAWAFETASSELTTAPLVAAAKELVAARPRFSLDRREPQRAARRRQKLRWRVRLFGTPTPKPDNLVHGTLRVKRFSERRLFPRLADCPLAPPFVDERPTGGDRGTVGIKFALRLPLVAADVRVLAVYAHHRLGDRGAIVAARMTRLADAKGWALLAANRRAASRLDRLRLARAMLSDVDDLAAAARDEVLGSLDAVALVRAAPFILEEILGAADAAPPPPPVVVVFMAHEAVAFAASAADLVSSVAAESVALVGLPDGRRRRRSRALDLALGTADDADVFRNLLRFSLVDGEPALDALYVLLQSYWHLVDGTATYPATAPTCDTRGVVASDVAAAACVVVVSKNDTLF